VGRAWWFAALIVVPAVLAGLGLLWPAPQIADDLRVRSEAALDGAGLGSVDVSVSGRDVRLDAVPAGAEQAALAAAGGVTGIREIVVGSAAVPPAPPGTAPTGALPTTPDDVARLSAEARQALIDRVGGIVAAAPIVFPADSAELAGPAADTVRRVAELLVAEPAARVDVDGYVADTPGTPEAAQQLSDRRAAVVADQLVAAGVDRGRITATGRGAARPLATTAASRRVEISIP
jgi:outer membrane protein OmpA-like peptidoglycan-associated protein